MTPKVTAVVLNWCGESVSRECLQSLRESDYPSLTILLVDNGSHDQSGERLREAFPDVDYLQTGSNLGYTGGNNQGIQWALERDADFILILNNDTALESRTVSQLLDASRGGGGRVGGVVPKILFYDDPNRIWYGGGEFDRLKGLGVHWREGELDDSGVLEELNEVTFMTGACCLILDNSPFG